MLFWMGATTTAAPYLPPFKKAFADSFSCRVMPMRPLSRGSVQLASADPAQAVRIHQNFLGTDEEWRTIRAGFRMLRDIAKPAAAAAVHRRRDLTPGPACTSDAEIDAHIRATMITVHHPVGTCMMGPASDDTAVVDGELRVIGADGLARGRCLGHAGSHRRRHQCAGDHDRREGLGSYPRARAAAAGERVV